MSSALSLVNRLASHDEQALVSALAIRAPKTIGVRDLFDLAEALLAPLSIDHGLARLSKDELTQVAVGEPDSELLAACDALLLGDAEHVFPEVLERANHWISATATDTGVSRAEARTKTRTKTRAETDTQTGDGPVPANLDDAVVGLQEGLVAVNLMDDLLAALTHSPARVNGTGTLSKAAAVQLEAVMPRSDIDLQTFVTWAVNTPLASVRTGALQVVSERIGVWTQMTNVERWLLLATTWLERIPLSGRRILRSTAWTEADLGAAAERELIVSHAWITPALNESLATARLLGLLRGVSVSPAAIAALTQGVGDATGDEHLRDFVVAHAPAEAETFIVQHDLSVIAPGPVSAQVSTRLRAMSDVESRGMASTFRISAESISRALASGIDGSELLDFLAAHSVTELPQNLVYLTNDLSAKHGSVRVSRISGRTIVEAATDQLAALLGVDSNVRHLQLTLASERTFATALEPRSVITVLVEAGYPAIPVDTPPATEESLEEDLDAGLRALVKRLRERDEDIPMDASWLKRQLDLAIRNKQRVTVTVQMPDGERDFELEVTALANGRLRGRDLRGAVERTLPLAFITAVSPAG
jgi:hypothetical protein